MGTSIGAIRVAESKKTIMRRRNATAGLHNREKKMVEKISEGKDNTEDNEGSLCGSTEGGRFTNPAPQKKHRG